MADSSIILKIMNYGVFIILTGLGVLFLLASPVDPARMVSRLIVGVVLIVIAIIILVVISLVIQRREYKIVKVVKGSNERDDQSVNIPSEIVCTNCRNPIEITDKLKRENKVICEKCGLEIKIPKSKVRW